MSKKALYMHLSIERLTSIGLNANDMCVLDWFYTFASSGNMTSRNIDGREFYWVNYDKVLSDFGSFLDITSAKTVSRMFARYVEKGILTRKILRNPSRKDGSVCSGNRVYFAIEKEMLSYLLDIKAVDNSAQGGLRCPKAEDTAVPGPRDSGVPINIPVNDIYIKDTAFCPVQNHEQKGEALKDETEAPEGDFIEMDITSKTRNIRKILCLVFEVPSSPFDTRPDFMVGIIRLLETRGLRNLGLIKDYFAWTREECLSKGPVNLFAYFAKVACLDRNLDVFLKKTEGSYTQKQIEKRDDTVRCAVCGTVHLISRECPVCKNTSNQNEEEVEIKKRIRMLSPALQDRINGELEGLYTGDCLDINKIRVLQSKKREIYERYGLTAKSFIPSSGSMNS